MDDHAHRFSHLSAPLLARPPVSSRRCHDASSFALLHDKEMLLLNQRSSNVKGLQVPSFAQLLQRDCITNRVAAKVMLGIVRIEAGS